MRFWILLLPSFFIAGTFARMEAAVQPPDVTIPSSKQYLPARVKTPNKFLRLSPTSAHGQLRDSQVDVDGAQHHVQSATSKALTSLGTKSKFTETDVQKSAKDLGEKMVKLKETGGDATQKMFQEMLTTNLNHFLNSIPKIFVKGPLP